MRESHIERDVGHGTLAGGDQLSGTLDPALDDITVSGEPDRLPVAT